MAANQLSAPTLIRPPRLDISVLNVDSHSSCVYERCIVHVTGIMQGQGKNEKRSEGLPSMSAHGLTLSYLCCVNIQ